MDMRHPQHLSCLGPRVELFQPQLRRYQLRELLYRAARNAADVCRLEVNQEDSAGEVS